MEDILLDITASELRQVGRLDDSALDKVNIMAELLFAIREHREHVDFMEHVVAEQLTWLYDLGYNIETQDHIVRISWC